MRIRGEGGDAHAKVGVEETRCHFGVFLHGCVYMSVRQAHAKKERRVMCVKNEWEEGARLVCRFRSTFSWKEDPCCFPLWPWLTV